MYIQHKKIPQCRTRIADITAVLQELAGEHYHLQTEMVYENRNLWQTEQRKWFEVSLAQFENRKLDLKTQSLNKLTFENINRETDENQQILISQTGNINKNKPGLKQEGWRFTKNFRKWETGNAVELLHSVEEETLTGKQRCKAQRISSLC